MSASNFYSKCGRYFIVNDKDFYFEKTKDFNYWAYQEYLEYIKEQIVDILSKKFNIDIYKVNKYDNNRNYGGNIFAEIINNFTDKKDNEVNVTIELIIRSGYYTGTNLDYDIKIDDYYNDNEKLTIKAEKWANKVADEIEKVYKKYTELYKLVCIFSNGEAIYSKA